MAPSTRRRRCPAFEICRAIARSGLWRADMRLCIGMTFEGGTSGTNGKNGAAGATDDDGAAGATDDDGAAGATDADGADISTSCGTVELRGEINDNCEKQPDNSVNFC